jgi:hypothetical protein
MVAKQYIIDPWYQMLEHGLENNTQWIHVINKVVSMRQYNVDLRNEINHSHQKLQFGFISGT